MAESTSDRIACPECGAIYRWSDKLAGHKIRCKCGATMRMPKEPGGSVSLVSKSAAAAPAAAAPPAPEAPAETDSTSGEYDLDLPADDLMPAAKPPAAAPPSDGKCPSCQQPVKPTAVICMNCGFNLAEGKKLKTAVGEEDAPGRKKSKRDLEEDAYTAKKAKMTDIIIPAVMLGLGILFVLVNAWGLFPITPSFKEAVTPTEWDPTPPPGSILSVVEMVKAGVHFVVQLPFLVAGVFFVARLFGTSFGSLTTALLKLAAVSIFMIAFGQVLYSGMDIITGGEGWMGTMVDGSVNFGLFMGLAIWMFDIDGLEAFVLYLFSFLVPFLAAAFFATIVTSVFVSP